MENKIMSLIHTEKLSIAEKRKIDPHIQIDNLRPSPDSFNDPQRKTDIQCTLCGRQFTSEIIQTEISLCPACSRHFTALSDDRIKSWISYWLRKSLHSEPSNVCCATRLAS
jgi:DNA-directed RNA polymerase subunit RPC12/RpoP